MSDTVEYWLDLADYDLETARAMLHSGRYLYVGFMCHQVIEKALKGCYVKVVGAIPPKIHDLERLAVLASVRPDLSPEQAKQIARLEPLNLQARYPMDRKLIGKAFDRSKCEKMLEETEEMFLWIRKRL